MLAEAGQQCGRVQPVRAHRGCVRIGGVSLSLSAASPDDIQVTRELEQFRAYDNHADIEVSVQWAQHLRAWTGETAFDSGALWTLSHDVKEFVFDFTSPILGPRPYKRMRVDQAFRSAQIVLNRELLEHYLPVYPLEYPADELLITNHLAFTGLGVEVHGCGLVDSEAGGQLFVGHSGAGKSTSTLLWKLLRDPKILSDDRLILRLHNGELWMYGTPWHGEAAFAEQSAVKINRIFVLQHGESNKIMPMSRPQAAGELFARCFPPFHSAPALERTVEFLDRIFNLVRCYEFSFVPDASAVEAVLGFHE
jgi:hypothetical protein